MGTLSEFLKSKGITEKQVVFASKNLETLDHAGRALMVKRAGKRRNKEMATKKYAELEMAKPAGLSRGVTEAQVVAAAGEKQVTRKVRSKIHRAVNAILAKKKAGPVEFKALFEGTTARVGKKKEEKKA